MTAVRDTEGADPASTPDDEYPWHVVVPVKHTHHGKSRLSGLGHPRLPVLSRAIADDTLTAVVGAVGAARVVLVTSDAELAADWRRQSVVVVDDPGAGLNAAVALGLLAVPAGGSAAALLGDLPALIATDLRVALHAARAHDQSLVPDAEGVGTVLRCAAIVLEGRPPFVPRFGPDSAARHEADGAHRLDLDLPRLRTDVDDADSLAVATALGLGRRTRSVLAR